MRMISGSAAKARLRRCAAAGLRRAGRVLAAVLVRLQVDQLQQLGDPVVDFSLGYPATRMARAMLSSTVIWGNRPPSWTT